MNKAIVKFESQRGKAGLYACYINGKFVNAVKNQIDVFEKQYKDPKNAAIFKAIYTNKQKSDYIK